MYHIFFLDFCNGAHRFPLPRCRFFPPLNPPSTFQGELFSALIYQSLSVFKACVIFCCSSPPPRAPPRLLLLVLLLFLFFFKCGYEYSLRFQSSLVYFFLSCLFRSPTPCNSIVSPHCFSFCYLSRVTTWFNRVTSAPDRALSLSAPALFLFFHHAFCPWKARGSSFSVAFSLIVFRF